MFPISRRGNRSCHKRHPVVRSDSSNGLRRQRTFTPSKHLSLRNFYLRLAQGLRRAHRDAVGPALQSVDADDVRCRRLADLNLEARPGPRPSIQPSFFSRASPKAAAAELLCLDVHGVPDARRLWKLTVHTLTATARENSTFMSLFASTFAQVQTACGRKYSAYKSSAIGLVT